jgi:NAD(P)-dependent dehydrogenase (short-subunit alcohol dehydrogenase family)
MQITSYFPKDMFKNKTVFVTGGGSGINLGVAKNFAALGANIGICGRSREKLDRAADELRALGAKVFAQPADVRDDAAMESVLQQTENELGSIHVLVCAAAGNFICPAEQLSSNGFKAVVDIDLLGSFNACRAAFPQLKKTKGTIVFISAGMSMIPYFAQSHVGAAKAGVDNLMRNLALEWGRFGIRSNSIIPGPIEDTEGMRRLAPGGLGEKLKKSIPLGRYGTVDEIGQAAVFLASPLAAYITGTVLIVDGGQNLPGSGMFAEVVKEAMQQAKNT